MKTITSEQFRITDPPSGIFSPAEGESWERGSYQYITWQIDSHAERVKISYTTDTNNKGERNWTTITCTASNTGSYKWPVPCNEKPSNDCYIKIEEVAE